MDPQLALIPNTSVNLMEFGARMGVTAKPDSPLPLNGKANLEPEGRTNYSETKPAEESEREDLNEADALQLLWKQFRQLAEFCSYLVSAKIDGAKVSVRTGVHRCVGAAMGFVAVSGLIIAAGCYVLSGLAQGLSVLLDQSSWAGDVLAGLLLLAGLGIGLYLTISKGKRDSLRRVTKKYEIRRSRQRAEFDNDVSERTRGGPFDGK